MSKLKRIDTLSTFSIKDIEVITGIKGHTLRIWEQRYGIIEPKRTETNIRYYDDDDLKQLLNISVLNNHGVKISEIAKLSKPQLKEAVLKHYTQSNEFSNHIKALVGAMLSFDEFEFHKLLTTCVLQHGLEQCMVNIIFPFLNEVGILWQIGSIQPTHEHFVTNLITQKLYVAIDGQIGKTNPNSKKFMLFLPQNEKHHVGLLFANYILRSRGHQVLFLGQEVPIRDLGNAFSQSHPEYILTVLTTSQETDFKQGLIAFLTANWPNSKILLSGSQVCNCDLEICDKVTIIRTVKVFIAFANSIS